MSINNLVQAASERKSIQEIRGYLDSLSSKPEELKHALFSTDGYGNTALHIFSGKNNVEGVKLVANFAAKFHISSNHSNESRALLIELLMTKNKYGNIALHIAGMRRNKEAVNALLEPLFKLDRLKELGDVLKLQDRYGKSSLHLIAQYPVLFEAFIKQARMAGMLDEILSLRDYNNKTIRDLAEYEGNPLAHKIDEIGLTDIVINNLAQAASEKKSIQEIKCYLDSLSSNPEELKQALLSRDKHGNTALHIFSDGNNIEVSKLIVDYAAKAHRSNNNNENHDLLVELLTAQNKKNHTTLHVAGGGKHGEVINALLAPLFNLNRLKELGEVLSCESKFGVSPLRLITQSSVLFDSFINQAQEAGMLREVFSLKDGHGRTMLDIAKHEENLMAQKRIDELCLDNIVINDLVRAASEKKSIQEIKCYLDSLSDKPEELKQALLLRDEHDNTVLHLFCEENNIEGIKLVIDSAVKARSAGNNNNESHDLLVELLTVQNNSGDTALHVAGADRRGEVINVLLAPLFDLNSLKELGDVLCAHDIYSESLLSFIARSTVLFNSFINQAQKAGILDKVLSFKDVYSRTILHLAIFAGNYNAIDKVSNIIKADNTLQDAFLARDSENSSLLHYATDQDNAILNKLMDSADNGILQQMIILKDKSGYTALHDAMRGYMISKGEVAKIHSISIYSKILGNSDLIPILATSDDNNRTLLKLMLYIEHNSFDELITKAKESGTLAALFNLEIGGKNIVALAKELKQKGIIDENILNTILSVAAQIPKQLEPENPSGSNNNITEATVNQKINTGNDSNGEANAAQNADTAGIDTTVEAKAEAVQAIAAALRSAALKKKTGAINELLKPLFDSKNITALGEVLKVQDKHGKSLLRFFAQTTTLKNPTLLFDNFIAQAQDAGMLREVFSLKDEHGHRTLLHIAADSNNEGAAKKLMDLAETHGLLKSMLLDLDCDGNTPLTSSLIHLDYGGEITITKAILDKALSKADIIVEVLTAENEVGGSPIYFIVRGNYTELFEGVVNAAIALGVHKDIANYTVRDPDDGSSLLEYAKKNSDAKVVSLCLKLIQACNDTAINIEPESNNTEVTINQTINNSNGEANGAQNVIEVGRNISTDSSLTNDSLGVKLDTKDPDRTVAEINCTGSNLNLCQILDQFNVSLEKLAQYIHNINVCPNNNTESFSNPSSFTTLMPYVVTFAGGVIVGLIGYYYKVMKVAVPPVPHFMHRGAHEVQHGRIYGDGGELKLHNDDQKFDPVPPALHLASSASDGASAASYSAASAPVVENKFDGEWDLIGEVPGGPPGGPPV